jgi:hypothetical protein
MAKMKNSELESLLASQQNNAVGALNGTIGQHRSSLMDRYNGEPYGDEVADRSKIVMTDIRDTLESIKPELLDIFYGGDKVVEFSPRGDEDVDAAEQETDVCNYVFNQKNNGFMVLYTWFTDALLLKNGYVKRYWDDREVTEIEEYDDLDPQEAVSIITDLEQVDGEVEIVERWGGPNEFGEMEPMGFKVKIVRELKEYKVEPVPPEEVYVSPQWNKLSFKDCPFLAHRSSRTVSDLIGMGFDRKQVEALPEVDDKLDSEEAETRFSGENFDENNLTSSTDISMRTVRVYENYILVDRDGDGIAELLQIFTGGDNGTILKRNGKLAIEEVRSTPFNTACPLPIPHKHYGFSIAELVEDLQRLRTVLVRQMVDNIVGTNDPDIVVDEDQMTDATHEDLAITQAGRVLRIPGGVASLNYLPVPNSASQSLQGIQYVDSLREERTGVTKHAQGLNADSLKPLAEGTVDQLMTASQKKILMIARIFAETAVAPMFLDMHADLRAGPLKSIGIKLNNEWVEVNPRTWKDRADMTVNVGLGTGDRDVQFQRLSIILMQQKEALAQGMPGVGPEQIHHTLSKMIELSGFKDVEAFFPDPANIPPAPPEPPQPDPAMMLAQVEMQKATMQRDTKMAELEIKKMDAETKRLDLLMKDDRERDLKAAEIEAKEADRMEKAIDGRALTNGGA